MTVRLPDDSKRLVIVGSTGSGKSQAGVWHLSNRSFDVMPWFVFNPKRDALIQECGMTDYDWTDKRLPTKPGLYNFSPVPEVDDDSVNEFLRLVVRSAVEDGRPAGLYIDEGYSVPKRSAPFRQILTQGRSLRIPTITLSQRPSWMDRFVWSEADFMQLFRLNVKSDQQVAAEWFPSNVPVYKRLPEYNSWYYDVGRHEAVQFRPVPDADTIERAIRAKLGVRRSSNKRIVL